MPGKDLDLIRHALTVARKHGCHGVQIGQDGWEFTAELERTQPDPGLSAAAPATDDDGQRPLRATLVGYYLAADKPLKRGAKIRKGDVVAGITALGIENDVEAPFDGEVTEVLVKEGDSLEFGQPIAMVQVGS